MSRSVVISLKNLYQSVLIKDRYSRLLTSLDKGIETFFALKPEAKFLIYDIEKDNIDKLQQYIDIKNITEFPHTNKGKYYTDQKEK
jgi:hypothetical protein